MTFTIDDTNIGNLLSASDDLSIAEALSREAYKRRLLKFVAVSGRLGEIWPTVARNENFTACREFLSTLSLEIQKRIVGYPSFALWIRSAESILAQLATEVEVRPEQLENVCVDFERFALAGAVLGDVESPLRAQLAMKPVDRVFLPGACAWLELTSLHGGKEQVFASWGRDGSVSLFSHPSAKEPFWQADLKSIPKLRNGVEVNCWDADLRLLTQRAYTNFEPDSPQICAWLSSLNDACDMIASCHSTLSEEIARYIRVLTPIVPPDPNTSVSSSSTVALGLIWLSLNSDVTTIAETVVHEYHHQKLNTLLLFDSVITGPTNEAMFYSPWRNDPRPLLGILHGAFAFGGVLDFYSHLALLRPCVNDYDQATERMHLLRNQLFEALDILQEHAEFSRVGRGLYAAMRRNAQHLPDYPISQSAKQRVEGRLAEHRRRWSAANGNGVSSPSARKMHGG